MHYIELLFFQLLCLCLFLIMYLFRWAFILVIVILVGYCVSHSVLMFANGWHWYWVDLATTEAAWEKGLMGRKALADNQGMLFVFPDQRNVSFWMKDTPIPLDIVFLNDQKQVVSISANAQPCLNQPEQTCATFQANQPVKYVLELKAGETKEKQVLVGAQAYWFPY